MPKSRKRKRTNVRLAISGWTPPEVLRSPTTGDLGFTEHPWFRMDDAALGLSTPTVMFDVEELRGNGYDPEDLGMTSVGTHQTAFEVPEIAVLADMKSRYDIDLHEPGPGGIEPPMIIGGVFDDPHPEEWWERIHHDQALIVIAGNTPLLADAYRAGPNAPLDFRALLAQSYIGRVRGLMIRGYSSGIGTHVPEV